MLYLFLPLGISLHPAPHQKKCGPENTPHNSYIGYIDLLSAHRIMLVQTLQTLRNS